MEYGFVIEVFQMLSTAQQQWSVLCLDQKTAYDLPIKNWVAGIAKPRIESLPFVSGTLHFVEFEQGLFLLFFARRNSLILVDLGKVEEIAQPV